MKKVDFKVDSVWKKSNLISLKKGRIKKKSIDDPEAESYFSEWNCTGWSQLRCKFKVKFYLLEKARIRK